MIRDRFKKVAHKAALRFFGMEWDASEAPEDKARGVASPAAFDPNLIPRVVDGSGDTPGPKHPSNIGRTWLASQVISSVSPFLIDIRPPTECAGGVIKGAFVLPGDQIKKRLHLLPAKDLRVTVYDQLGSDETDALAAWLREEGWVLARRLVGGYAEWIEHGEPVTVPQAPAGGRFHVGMMVERKGGKRAWVQEAWLDGGAPRYTLWTEDGGFTGPHGEDDFTR